MQEKKFLYRLEVPESHSVKFADLPHIIAKAMHPADSDPMAYGGARINFEGHLRKAVEQRRLIVRNPLDSAPIELPIGEMLRTAVLMPSVDGLRDVLADHLIELVSMPHGSGPKYWTLENAAKAIGKQEEWNQRAVENLLIQMIHAAACDDDLKKLTVRDPHTDLPTTGESIYAYWDLVSPCDVNAWLMATASTYRWYFVHPATRQSESWVFPYCEAAEQLGDQLGWDRERKARFVADIDGGIRKKALRVRNLDGMLIEDPENVHHQHWHLSRDDMNDWLRGHQRAPFRWETLLKQLPVDGMATVPQAITGEPFAEAPDAVRRLARLRHLGGNVKLSGVEWKISGISALVKAEKSEGRKRCDEKTIRSDLKEAAQAERDARRAGYANGLGQR